MRLSVSHECELEDRLCRLSKAKATGGGGENVAGHSRFGCIASVRGFDAGLLVNSEFSGHCLGHHSPRTGGRRSNLGARYNVHCQGESDEGLRF